MDEQVPVGEDVEDHTGVPEVLRDAGEHRKGEDALDLPRLLLVAVLSR